MASEAAGFLEEVRVLGGEISGALVENFDDAFRALRAGERSEHRGLDANAAGLFEVLEIVE